MCSVGQQAGERVCDALLFLCKESSCPEETFAGPQSPSGAAAKDASGSCSSVTLVWSPPKSPRQNSQKCLMGAFHVIREPISAAISQVNLIFFLSFLYSSPGPLGQPAARERSPGSNTISAPGGLTRRQSSVDM